MTDGKTLDAHFWNIDSNNRIIDDTTVKYKRFFASKGITHFCYLPYTDEDQKTIIDNLTASQEEIFAKKGNSIDKECANINYNFLGEGHCFIASVFRNRRLGEKMVAGCLGHIQKDGSIGWLYGHPHQTLNTVVRMKGDPLIRTETRPEDHPNIRLVDITAKRVQKPNERCSCFSGRKYKVCCGAPRQPIRYIPPETAVY
jgi:hypothetical protein